MSKKKIVLLFMWHHGVQLATTLFHFTKSTPIYSKEIGVVFVVGADEDRNKEIELKNSLGMCVVFDTTANVPQNVQNQFFPNGVSD